MPRARPVELDPEDSRIPLPYPRLDVPDWNDIIHLRPDTMLPPAERLERKRGRARRIRTSPVSPLSQSTATLMAAVDDVQDGLVTLSLATRIAALRFPILRPLANLSGKGADALNLGNLFRVGRQAPQLTKRNAEARMQQSPGYYQGRARNATSLNRALPGVGEALQVLQTSDRLTGVGLSLGPIMAAPVQATAALLKAPPLPLASWQELAGIPDTTDRKRLAREQALRIEPIARNNTIAFGIAAAVSVWAPSTLALGVFTETISRVLPQNVPTAAEQMDAAARILEGTAILAPAPDVLTPHEHLLIATAHHLALTTLEDLIPSLPLADLGAPFLTASFQPHLPRHWMTIRALGLEDIPVQRTLLLPVHGTPASLPLKELQAAIQDVAPDVLPLWRDAVHTDEQEIYAGALATYAARAPWRILEGEDPLMDESFIPQGKALTTLLDHALFPPGDFSPALTWDLLTDLGQRWFSNDRSIPVPDQLARDLATCCSNLNTNHPRE